VFDVSATAASGGNLDAKLLSLTFSGVAYSPTTFPELFITPDPFGSITIAGRYVYLGTTTPNQPGTITSNSQAIPVDLNTGSQLNP